MKTLTLTDSEATLLQAALIRLQADACDLSWPELLPELFECDDAGVPAESTAELDQRLNADLAAVLRALR